MRGKIWAVVIWCEDLLFTHSDMRTLVNFKPAEVGWSVLIFATVHRSSVSYNLFCAAVNPHDVADVVVAAAPWCFWIAMPSKLKYCIVTLPDVHHFETVQPETGTKLSLDLENPSPSIQTLRNSQFPNFEPTNSCRPSIDTWTLLGHGLIRALWV